MAWTLPTALFFVAIATMLLVLTLSELKFPTTLRRGLLPIPTTRGDRVFISLLSAAFLHLGWLGVTALPLWGASIIAIVVASLILRWG